METLKIDHLTGNFMPNWARTDVTVKAEKAALFYFINRTDSSFKAAEKAVAAARKQHIALTKEKIGE